MVVQSRHESPNIRGWVLGLLFFVVGLVYRPAFYGQFIWDDDAHVSQNLTLRSVGGLIDIWTKPGAVQQYYPMTYSLFWLQYHLWGQNPLGYHLVNILLHALNAALVWWILSQLKIPGAWVAAGIFALHPVHVESVAWISELKNVLSGFFYLSAAALFLRAGKQKLFRIWYVLASVAFLFALLSKSVTATLPVAIVAIHAWQTRRIDKKCWLPMLPWAVLALGAGLFTVEMERRVIGAQGEMWHWDALQHCLLAGRIFWFYPGKIFNPHALTFVYPRWPMPMGWENGVLPLAVIVTLLALAYGRKWWGALPFACAAFYLITISPVLGLVSVYPMRFSFVADHFQYLASLGPIVLLVIILDWFRRHLGFDARSGPTKLIALFLLLNLGLATFSAAKKYQSSYELWIDTLTKNPTSGIAHHNLAMALFERQQLYEAVDHLRLAIRFDPTLTQPYVAMAYVAVQSKRWKEALGYYETAIRLGVNDPDVLQEYAVLKKKAF